MGSPLHIRWGGLVRAALRDREGFVPVRDLEDAEAAARFLGLGEGAVSDKRLAR